jgi:hypothetical protein
MRLIPGPVYYIRSPVLIAYLPVFRIYCPGKDPFGAFLHAPEAAIAGIQVFRFLHSAHMQIIIFEYVIDTFFLYALLTAPSTIFPEFYRGILAHRVKPGWSGLCLYMIFFRHIFSLYFIA